MGVKQSNQLSLIRFFESFDKTILGNCVGCVWVGWRFWPVSLLLFICSIYCSFWAAWTFCRLTATFCCCWATWKSRYCLSSWPDICLCWVFYYINVGCWFILWIESWSGPWSWDGISIIFRGACWIWSCCGCWIWFYGWAGWIFWITIGYCLTGLIMIYFFYGYCWQPDCEFGTIEFMWVVLLPLLDDPTVLVKS